MSRTRPPERSKTRDPQTGFHRNPAAHLKLEALRRLGVGNRLVNCDGCGTVMERPEGKSRFLLVDRSRWDYWFVCSPRCRRKLREDIA